MATRKISQVRSVRERQALNLRSLRPGLAALLLLLCVLLGLMFAYYERPFVRVDIGSRTDYTYISGFHAREFSPIEPSLSFAWPARSDTLVIEEALNPALGMVTVTLDDFRPSTDFPRRLIAVYANEQRLTTLDDRGGKREFKLLLPDGIARSGLKLRLESIPDKISAVPPVQALQATFSGARTYRWSDGQGRIYFPAIGHGPLRLDVQTAVFHPDNQPVNASLYANGQFITALPEYRDTRRLSLLLSEQVLASGDLSLELRSDVFRDPRPLGILMDEIALSPADLGVGQRGMLPPWSAFGFGVLIILGAYLSLRMLKLPVWWTCGALAALVFIGAWALANYRLPMGLYLQPLALLVLCGALITPLMERFAGWLFRQVGIELDPWLGRMLVLIFIVGFWLKAGGMVFPSMRSIDISWHMDRVRLILDGQLAEIYKPGAFSESVMPIDEWGQNRPVIPYSPFFHIFSTVFALVPWWSMELSANLMSAFLDTSRVFLLAILALKAGLSTRATLLAVLMYAVTPFTFLLHSWGNVPTTFGMWWTLVCTVVIVGLYPRLTQRGPFIVLTLLTLATMLFYTVMAVFYALFVIGFVLIMWLRPAAVDKRPLRAIVLATGLGVLLSVLIYYGQYIPGMIERTIPYMTSLATKGSQSVGVERASFGEYLWSYVPHLDYHFWPGDYLYYGVAIPVLFAIPGFLALRRQPVVWAILAAWYSVAVFFLIAGARMSMVDKQLFYVFPAICICWAIYAERLWRSGWWARVMLVAIYIFTLFAAIDLWIIRIMRSPVE